MSKFLEIGVDKQYSAINIRQAKYFYNQSCNLCTTHGLRFLCANCPIACANANVIQIFNSIAQKNQFVRKGS